MEITKLSFWSSGRATAFRKQHGNPSNILKMLSNCSNSLCREPLGQWLPGGGVMLGHLCVDIKFKFLYNRILTDLMSYLDSL